MILLATTCDFLSGFCLEEGSNNIGMCKQTTYNTFSFYVACGYIYNTPLKKILISPILAQNGLEMVS